nr:MAG TPA: hypothetical protein [Crassvirales sp.]
MFTRLIFFKTVYMIIKMLFKYLYLISPMSLISYPIKSLKRSSYNITNL